MPVSHPLKTGKILRVRLNVSALTVRRKEAVKEIVKECASGLNDTRPKLTKLLKNPEITRIVVEHKDRLTRFGFNYIRLFRESQGCQIEIINESVNDRDDLMQDSVSLVTCFTAGLYGQRRSKRKTEKLIRELENEN
jgi:predicted site-specific integrase-resolvase